MRGRRWMLSCGATLCAAILGLGGWLLLAPSAEADAQSDRWTFTLCFFQGGNGYGVSQCEELLQRCATMSRRDRRRRCTFEIPVGTDDRVKQEVEKDLDDADQK